MKKFSSLAIGLIVIGTGFLHAQTNQGNLLIGLSSDIFDLGYTSSKTKSDADGSEDPNKNFNINFHPKMGYFLMDNLVIGLDLSVGFSNYKSGSDEYKLNSTTLSAGPFVRYYIPTSNVLPFFELGGSLGTQNTKFELSQEVDKYKTGILSFGGGIGLAVPLGDRVMVDFLAGYRSDRYKDKEDNEDNERRIMGTIGLEVGFTFLLGSN
jgi:outer membrane protein